MFEQICIKLTFLFQETYFVRYTDNKAPKGKLYAKYFNKIRSLKNHGLVSQGPSKKSKLEKNSLTRISASFNDELGDEYYKLLLKYLGIYLKIVKYITLYLFT